MGNIIPTTRVRDILPRLQVSEITVKLAEDSNEEGKAEPWRTNMSVGRTEKKQTNDDNHENWILYN